MAVGAGCCQNPVLMGAPDSADASRERTAAVVGFSVLLPGLGHWMAGRRRAALVWFALCQGLLMLGFALAGGTQQDFGFPFGLGGWQLIHVTLPELGNFLGTQFAVASWESADYGGRFPENLPLRGLGYLLSGASGVLACFCAAHAAGAVRRDRARAQLGRAAADTALPLDPGKAALASLLLPGLGHWLTGRRFKAKLLCATVLGLFLLGMVLGDFADFDRQRHPYYWVGQMFLGLPGWLVAFATSGARFSSVLPYQDAGLLFTTSAGFFNVIVALDAYQRAEQDLERVVRGKDAS